MSRTLISDQLRGQLLAAGESLYELAGRAGVPRSCLAAFVRGDRGLTVDTIDRVCAALGLQLVQTGRRRKPPRRSA